MSQENYKEEKFKRFRGKVAAFLHDPIYKAFDIRGHKKEAERIMEKVGLVEYIENKPKAPDTVGHEKEAESKQEDVGLGEYIENKFIDYADHIASAMSRIVVKDFSKNKQIIVDPKKEKVEFIDILDENKKVNIEHYFSEEKVKEDYEKIIDTVKDFNKDKQDKYDAAYEAAYWFLWRFVPLIDGIEYLPADTRAPNHSIYDHLVQTSAVYACITDNKVPAFLLFTINPVQDFIKVARKTSDLWSGSYILSYLTFKAMEFIIDEYGPDHIIYPNLLFQPLVDKKIIEKLKDYDFLKDYVNKLQNNEEKLMIANFPNRFLAIIPFDTSDTSDNNIARSIASKVEESLKNAIHELSEFISQKLGFTSYEKIEEHLLSYFQVYWAILPWTDEIDKVNIYKKDRAEHKKAIEAYESLVANDVLVQIVKDIINLAPYETTTKLGSVYSLLLVLVEKLLAARKSFRNPIKNLFYKSNGCKCTLCGEFNAIIKIQDLCKENRNYRSLINLIQENEHLCGVCITKRLFPLFADEKLGIKLKFPSTSEMASIRTKIINQNIDPDFIEKIKNTLKEINQNSSSVPKLKCNPLFNIDGQWLIKENYDKKRIKREYGVEVDEDKLKEIKGDLEKYKINPSRYYAILMMDGDRIGKWLKGEFNLTIEQSIHPKVVSTMRTIMENPEVSDSIKKSFSYILDKNHPNSPSIHQLFSRRLSHFALEEVKKVVEDEFYGKVVYAGGDDVLALLPIDSVFACAYKLQESFKSTLSSKATASTGITIVHYKYPLYLAIEEARLTEKLAKNEFNRNSFCIKVIKNSGEIRITGGKWRLIPRLLNIIKMFREEEVSSRFAYKILQLVEEQIECDTCLFNIELKRIFYNSSKGDKSNFDYIKSTFDFFLEDIKDKRKSMVYFANFLVIARFLASEIRADDFLKFDESYFKEDYKVGVEG